MSETAIRLIPYLMHRIIWRMLDRAAEDFGPLGLDIRMSRLLIAVRANPGIGAGRLAGLVSLEMSALSHLLRRATAEGLVTRERAEGDARAVSVGLTPKGAGLAETCLALSRSHERMILGDMTEAEAEALRALLVRALRNVGAEAGEARARAGDRVEPGE